jgi:hypothetical protein
MRERGVHYSLFFFPLRTENERGAQKGLYVDPLRYAVVN